MGRVDSWVDARFEALRGRAAADRLAAVSSFVGDHGLVWFLIGLVLARRPGRARRRAVRSLTFTGMAVPLVNGALKRAVGRNRPAGEPVSGLLRVPRTSSFPSGHTMAAWCAAVMLAEEDPRAPLYYGVAAAVSASRIHVRHHHATDVAAGSALGTVLGMLGRRLFAIGPARNEPGHPRR